MNVDLLYVSRIQRNICYLYLCRRCILDIIDILTFPLHIGAFFKLCTRTVFLNICFVSLFLKVALTQVILRYVLIFDV